MEKMMDYQKLYNSLLKKSLDHKKEQISLLKSIVDQSTMHFEKYREYKNVNYEKNPDDIYDNCKNDLIRWLHSINIDVQSINKVHIFYIKYLVICYDILLYHLK